MNKADKYFIKNLKKIKSKGVKDINPRAKYADGVAAHSIFITQVNETYDLSKGEFPITTLRNTAIKTGINEILWIYQKQTSDLNVAREMGIDWWEEWNIGDDTIGLRYGKTVKEYNLINKLIHNLKNNPYDRGHIITLWQEEHLKTKGLRPCAYETIWSVREKYLDMTLIQRSSDYIMAGYINKIQYVALQMMIANTCGYKVGKFNHFVQNLHIYDRHLEAVDEILNREPINVQPRIELVENKDFYDYKITDFKLYDTKFEKLTKKLEIAI